jgi:hypothetical protein
MYKADELIYIQMPKTGCSHIALILSRLFDGRQIGKHNAASRDDIDSDRHFISSIRNPWDWYVSLWTFGVQGNGGLCDRLTRRSLVRCLKSAVQNPRRDLARVFYELTRDVNKWRNLYNSSDNVDAFRSWLFEVHDPRNRHQLGEGYGRTAIAEFCGFMTYRYLYLCCTDVEKLCDPRSIGSYDDLVEFEREHCYIHDFVRQESLEDSLCGILEKIRPLTQGERDLIHAAKKTNTSKRSLLLSDYYDDASIALVGDREHLLIDKFDYRPPGMALRSMEADRPCPAKL